VPNSTFPFYLLFYINLSHNAGRARNPILFFRRIDYSSSKQDTSCNVFVNDKYRWSCSQPDSTL
jgi:hypothetical protein